VLLASSCGRLETRHFPASVSCGAEEVGGGFGRRTNCSGTQRTSLRVERRVSGAFLFHATHHASVHRTRHNRCGLAKTSGKTQDCERKWLREGERMRAARWHSRILVVVVIGGDICCVVRVHSFVFTRSSGSCPCFGLCCCWWGRVFFLHSHLMCWLQSDPMMDDFTHIIMDEPHERQANGDFLLNILRRLSRQREDVRIILTSATMQQYALSLSCSPERVAVLCCAALCFLWPSEFHR
jgi:hypothetical protein